MWWTASWTWVSTVPLCQRWLAVSRLPMRQSIAQGANCCWGYTRGTASSFGLSTRDQANWRETNEGAQRWLRDWTLLWEKTGTIFLDSWSCLAQFREEFTRIYKYLKQRCEENGVRTFTPVPSNRIKRYLSLQQP